MVLPVLIPAVAVLGKVAIAAISTLAVLTTAVVTDNIVQDHLKQQDDLIEQCKNVTNSPVVIMSDDGHKVVVNGIDMSEEITASINEQIEVLNRQYNELTEKFSNLKQSVDDNSADIGLIKTAVKELAQTDAEVMTKIKELTQIENEMVTKMNQSFEIINKILENFNTLPGFFKMVFFGILFMILLYVVYRVVRSLMDYTDYRLEKKRQQIVALIGSRKTNGFDDQQIGTKHRGLDKF